MWLEKRCGSTQLLSSVSTCNSLYPENEVKSDVPDAIVCSLSLLLCRNLPNAWNRESVSSFPNGKQSTSSKQLVLSSLSFDDRIGLLCGLRQRYCRELIACLISPPLALAIRSIESAPTSSCSFLHIAVSVFLIELTVTGLKLT